MLNALDLDVHVLLPVVVLTLFRVVVEDVPLAFDLHPERTLHAFDGRVLLRINAGHLLPAFRLRLLHKRPLGRHRLCLGWLAPA